MRVPRPGGAVVGERGDPPGRARTFWETLQRDLATSRKEQYCDGLFKAVAGSNNAAFAVCCHQRLPLAGSVPLQGPIRNSRYRRIVRSQARC
jgi:hypothetical protein